MQQPTSKQLFAYWDHIRNGRIAPRRFEIEPAKIANILRETFIAECAGLMGFRFRLAGTQICQEFGRELRGLDFLSLWSFGDKDAVASLVRTVLHDGSVGHGTFLARTDAGLETSFEFTLMPLIHTGTSINRLLGSITAIDRPFWLGTEPLTTFEIVDAKLLSPDGAPDFMKSGGADIVHLNRRRFRVVEGGLS
jgi:hypothetical protein